MSIDIGDVTISPEQREQLAKLANSMGKSPSEVLDQLLQQHLISLPDKSCKGNPRTLYDAFAEDESIGMVSSGPDDMSTNPKYMEGFGQSGS